MWLSEYHNWIEKLNYFVYKRLWAVTSSKNEEESYDKMRSKDIFPCNFKKK